MRAELLSAVPWRIAVVLFGGMLALQSSAAFDLTKIAYLAATTVCVAGALLAVWRVRESAAVQRGRAWILASGALAVLLTISVVVAIGEGTALLDSVRDLSSYALFAAVPILALDPQAGRSRTALVVMLVIAGILGGISWAVEWLSRREILELPFNRVVFPSGQLPGALYLFALASAMTSIRRRWLWVAVAAVTLALFLVTGTRSSLLLPASGLVMLVVAGRAWLRSSVGAYATHAAGALVLLVLFQMGGAAADDLGATGPGASSAAGDGASPGTDVIGDRFGSIPEAIGRPTSDPSIRERVAQYEAAWELFSASPIVGVGPGHPIEWVDVSGYPRADFTADTPLIMPAKFGILGVLVFAAIAIAFGRTVTRALRQARPDPVSLALLGFGVWTLVSLPLGWFVEDKGASLALMLLLAMTFATPPWRSA